MKALLKPFGATNDQALLAILTFFHENPERRVNENELTLMGFKRWNQSQRVWIPFATETIGRKARKLREWGLLESGKDTQGHTWFAWKGGEVKKEEEYEVKIINGRPVAIAL